MSKLVWDQTGQRIYETGVNQGVLYPFSDGKYQPGVAWSGLISVTESPTGAEPNAHWADNIKYLNLLSAEEFEATVEAYTYPDEFAECDGSATLAKGVMIGQQPRKMFGLSYKTVIGDDTTPNRGYKLHIIYGALAAPSDKAYQTINDSPEAIQFSWSITTTPAPVKGHQATAKVTIDSTKVEPGAMEKLEERLYGGLDGLPTPDEIIDLIGEALEG